MLDHPTLDQLKALRLDGMTYVGQVFDRKAC